MSRFPTCALTFLLLAAAGPGLSAQDAAAEKKAEHQTRPQGWRIVTDRVEADTSEIYFATMEPGFHVTSGPAAIYYHPDSTATAPFRVDGEFHLFEPGRRNEAFGLFFGGRDLEGSYQAYTYFLVRRSGEYLIKRREGTSTETLEGWTAHDAVTGWDERDEGAASVRNVLAVEATGGELVFLVNGREVSRMERSAGLAVDGVVGVRVNHALDLHVGGIGIDSP